MDPITQQTVLAAAGAGGDPVYVDDVFSTFLYEGTNSAWSPNVGIDFAGEGGLTWIKSRNNSYAENHTLVDTERVPSSGNYRYLATNNTNNDFEAGISGFTSTGFTFTGGNNQYNGSLDYVSWNFRKAPGFFDIITWTGTDGSAQRVLNHSLDSVPGMVICKSYSNSGTQWYIYHKSLGLDKYITFTSGSANTSTGAWNSVTSTTFGLGTAANLNAAGRQHVAYLFADDDASFGTGHNESIIKCGGFTATNTWGNFKVDLGFEPQFVLMKKTSATGDWIMLDSMRGITGPGDYPLSDTSTFFSALQASDDAELEANNSSAESTQGRASLYSQGFLGTTGAGGGVEYIYMAIRRPTKPPEAATEVFTVDSQQINNLTPFYKTSGHISDFVLSRKVQTTMDWQANSRLTGTQTLITNSNSTESGNSYYVWDYMDGMNSYSTSGNDGYFHWSFKRAPGFMDVVAYSGTGGNQNITHNLEVAPEFYIVKRRNATEDWATYSAALGSNKYNKLNTTSSSMTNTTIWNNTSPTSSVFTVGNDGSVNNSGDSYIAYLFATLPGISKVGSYSGSSSAVDVDCGFTNGARFVIIKRADSSGDWYVFDTTRGIGSGNDPFLKLNSSEDQNSSQDYIDPLNAGFTANTGNNDINATGGTYIFLAIA